MTKKALLWRRRLRVVHLVKVGLQYDVLVPMTPGHFRTKTKQPHGLLTCSKNVDVKVSFVFVVWKEPCK
jgi:hypothetical protein